MCNTAQSADLSMMTELYEFTLADGYFSAGMQDTVACFDLFFRRVPDGGGFAYDGVLDDHIWMKYAIAIMVMIAIYPFAWAIDRYAPWLIGKKKQS